MPIPVFSRAHVEAAVSPVRALEAVRDAFVAYASGDWTMPPKVYVPAYPAGDFRAMPALGGGHALLKWVTSFPGNPAQGLPTVSGLVLLSDASNGMLVAALDAGAVTAPVVVTVTPGREPVFAEGSLRPGQHVSLMGADGPGKAEIAVEELARVRVFCDDWEQASHNGDLSHAVEAGRIARADATQLGDVLAGTSAGRRGEDEITVFDSTGLAIQDLAVALAAVERAAELDLPTIEL